MDEKREIVHALSKWSHGASEILQSWSRQEILEVLCAEMGKERKYTGLTKVKIIEQLMKIVSEKNLHEHATATDNEPKTSSDSPQKPAKRQRKSDNPNRLSVPTNVATTFEVPVEVETTNYCKNIACKAALGKDYSFCKRCSCCICHKYDDNKDPSLWLICSSEVPFQGVSCGMSCHLECALKNERAGIIKDKLDNRLDGSFYCVSCGKMNDILGSWRKQLLIARDTRRVDILCYRVSLCQKILNGTKIYQNLYEIVDKAVTMLEADVGPLTGLPVKMGRGIVNRLSAGPEVQKLCSAAIESLDSVLSARASDVPADHTMVAPKLVTLEDIRSSSITVRLMYEESSLGNGTTCNVWHRKSVDLDYPREPTCTVFPPNWTCTLSSLAPDTDYLLKLASLDNGRELGTCEVSFRTAIAVVDVSNANSKEVEVERTESPATNCSSLSNPSSVEDETNNVNPSSNESETRGDNYLNHHDTAENMISANMLNGYSDKIERGINGDASSLLDEEHSMGKICSVSNADAVNLENKQSLEEQMVEETSTDNGSTTPHRTGKECVPVLSNPVNVLPITPCKFDNTKDGLQRSCRPKLAIKDLDNGSGKEEEPRAGSSSKKRKFESLGDESGTVDKDFEYYVKMIRWLECEGHIEAAFRQKFLTWYGLRASPQEVRIVKVFVDTFIEDPESLAGQLIDSFSDVISNKRSSALPAGFCLKLWH
ncbi:OLC1v1035144C3 [Oldenlandia corymbosa var. corymbosa]|nr:OLC1v1035144C3 [Oldenlandia corymbosa var. corymbosa]